MGAAITLSLKRAIASTGGVITYPNGIALMTGGNIGLGQYPIFNEAYRNTLNGKIIDHYWNREIGEETVEMFKHRMRRTMNEIMPLYNKLYLSEQIVFDPMKTIDLNTVTTSDSTQTAEGSSTSTGSGTGSQESRAIDSQFPQVQLNASGDYASAGADVESSSTSQSDGTEQQESISTANVTGDSTVSGYQGNASEMLMRYREALLNIDRMVIQDLEICFLQIFDIGDSYTNGRYNY